MQNSPLVSIIMNCYNGERYLKEAIDSVIAQTYKNLEIIFWDNQSNDGSANIAKSYNDDRIKYFYAKNHTTLGEARNLALKQCSGKYIAFLDVDDMWLGSKLEVQISAMENNPNVAISYTSFYRYCEDTKKTTETSVQAKCGNLFNDLVQNYNCGILTVVVKADNDNLYFDNKLRFAEDYDLVLRICSNNDALALNTYSAVYREHENADTAKYMVEQFIEAKDVLERLDSCQNIDINSFNDAIKTFSQEIKLSKRLQELDKYLQNKYDIFCVVMYGAGYGSKIIHDRRFSGIRKKMSYIVDSNRYGSHLCEFKILNPSEILNIQDFKNKKIIFLITAMQSNIIGNIKDEIARMYNDIEYECVQLYD